VQLALIEDLLNCGRLVVEGLGVDGDDGHGCIISRVLEFAMQKSEAPRFQTESFD
jgi:hypothetical protein